MPVICRSHAYYQASRHSSLKLFFANLFPRAKIYEGPRGHFIPGKMNCYFRTRSLIMSSTKFLFTHPLEEALNFDTIRRMTYTFFHFMISWCILSALSFVHCTCFRWDVGKCPWPELVRSDLRRFAAPAKFVKVPSRSSSLRTLRSDNNTKSRAFCKLSHLWTWHLTT